MKPTPEHKPTAAAIAQAAQGAILELSKMARQGSRAALEELWRIGMLSADELDGLAMHEDTKIMVGRFAKTKRSWPFKLAAVSEFNKGNKTSNPEAFAKWLRLGEDTAIRLGGGRGEHRDLNWNSPAGFAYRARLNIEADFKAYGKLSDDEILSGFYPTWKCRHDLKPDSKTRKNQERFLEYIQKIKAITNLHDDNQWMKAAELWVSVYSEGEPNAPDLWPPKIYARAKKNERSVATVVSEWLIGGLASITASPSDKPPSV